MNFFVWKTRPVESNSQNELLAQRTRNLLDIYTCCSLSRLLARSIYTHSHIQYVRVHKYETPNECSDGKMSCMFGERWHAHRIRTDEGKFLFGEKQQTPFFFSLAKYIFLFMLDLYVWDTKILSSHSRLKSRLSMFVMSIEQWAEHKRWFVQERGSMDFTIHHVQCGLKEREGVCAHPHIHTILLFSYSLIERIGSERAAVLR